MAKSGQSEAGALQKVLDDAVADVKAGIADFAARHPDPVEQKDGSKAPRVASKEQIAALVRDAVSSRQGALVLAAVEDVLGEVA